VERLFNGWNCRLAQESIFLPEFSISPVMKTAMKKGEEMVMITHPHWITLAVPAVITIAGLVVGFFIHPIAGLVALFGFGLYFLYKVLERQRNLWAVTNLRVIDEFGVFSNNAKESPLDKINNVSYHQSLAGRILGFGEVQIQTAAEVGATTYKMVTKPAGLKDAITRMKEEGKDWVIRRQAEELAGAISAGQKAKADVAAEIEKLYDLK
jgi:uncharacterized membrane protein YdbT with pleckstrin-like domain